MLERLIRASAKLRNSAIESSPDVIAGLFLPWRPPVGIGVGVVRDETRTGASNPDGATP